MFLKQEKSSAIYMTGAVDSNYSVSSKPDFACYTPLKKEEFGTGNETYEQRPPKEKKPKKMKFY